MPPKQDSTSAEFLNVASLFGHIVFTAIARALTYPWRTFRCPSLYSDVLYAGVRCMLDRITIAQSRYLNPSTTARYFAHCRTACIAPNTLEVETMNGTILAHWIGSSDAETVILYLHGGGYTQSANHGNFQYMSKLVQDLNNHKSRSVAALVIAYTLAPEATYPTQLRETVAVLTHLIKIGHPPSSIIISGDSAGGNLALSLLSHLLHPHPNVPAITLHEPLSGTLLYSPWTGFSTTYTSYNNEQLDMLSSIALRKWSAMFLDKSHPTNAEADPGPISGDAWTESCRNSASWWHDLHKIVGSVFVAFGSHEVLLDPIKELEIALKKGWIESGGDENQVTFLEGPKEAHIAPIVDIMRPGKRAKSNTQVAIEEWYHARLQQ